jgi:hypothetical protein
MTHRIRSLQRHLHRCLLLVLALHGADPDERINLAGVEAYADVLAAFRERTRARSSELTREGRAYKEAAPVALRPAEDVYCW